jgi:putative FmdB family regulatory protein
MPLFEYECLGCAKRFEEFVLGDTKPRCPSCEGGELRKLLSVFAVGSAGAGAGARASEAPSGCGTCGDPRGPGSCAVS